MVSTYYFFGRSTEKEVYIEDSTSCDVAEDGCSIFVVGYYGGLSVRITEEYSEKLARFGRFYEAEGMRATLLLAALAIIV